MLYDVLIFHVSLLYRDKVAFGTVFLYGFFSFFSIGFDECYSLWSSTDRSLGMDLVSFAYHRLIVT